MTGPPRPLHQVVGPWRFLSPSRPRTCGRKAPNSGPVPRTTCTGTTCVRPCAAWLMLGIGRPVMTIGVSPVWPQDMWLGSLGGCPVQNISLHCCHCGCPSRQARWVHGDVGSLHAEHRCWILESIYVYIYIFRNPGESSKYQFEETSSYEPIDDHDYMAPISQLIASQIPLQ